MNQKTKDPRRTTPPSVRTDEQRRADAAKSEGARLDAAARIPHAHTVESLGAAGLVWRDRKGLLVLLGAIAAPEDARQRIEAALPAIAKRDPPMAELLRAVINGNSKAAWAATREEVGYRRTAGAGGLFDVILQSFTGETNGDGKPGGDTV